jgi:hypothetical protein
MTSTASKEPVDSVRIVMAKSCPSITGKSTLTYHVGMAGNEPQIRIHGNTGPGYFNDEWIAVSKVIDALPKGEPFTSYTLRSVFKGRSMNSRAFLMAALSSEGVVRRSMEHPRCWERADVEAFWARVQGGELSSTHNRPKPKPSQARPVASGPKEVAAKPSPRQAAKAPVKSVPKPKK